MNRVQTNRIKVIRIKAGCRMLVIGNVSTYSFFFYLFVLSYFCIVLSLLFAVIK